MAILVFLMLAGTPTQTAIMLTAASQQNAQPQEVITVSADLRESFTITKPQKKTAEPAMAASGQSEAS